MTDHQTPLGFLALKGDFILVKLLCEMKGVECNVQDNEGNTPLMIASQGGKFIIWENN
jgi:ankyrin repeat protein